MFENVKTYCKTANEQQALNHAAMTIKNDKVIESGVEHTDIHGWRSWFITEQWTGDKVGKEIMQRNY